MVAPIKLDRVAAFRHLPALQGVVLRMVRCIRKRSGEPLARE